MKRVSKILVRRMFLAAVALALVAGALFGVASPPALHAASAGLGLTLPQGWNLIADPGGIVPSGPAYTLQQHDTAYEAVKPGTPLTPGLGYWAQAQNRSGLPLPAGQLRATIQAPSGHFVMVGDPSGIVSAQVSGADVLLTYDPIGGYSLVTNDILQPGQGAFALSNRGGAISLVAQATPTAICSTVDLGSACPVNGVCPQGYPVAITDDTLAHPPVELGDPAVQGTIVLCFNDMSQAAAAGYQPAPPFRIILSGPVSAVTDNIQITVERAILETPAAFVARAAAAGEQLAASKSRVSAAGLTAIVTVEYRLDNLNRPPTAVSFGVFRSTEPPGETVPGVSFLVSQVGQIVHAGVPSTSSVSGGFAKTPFSTITEVDWLLQQPLTDSLSVTPHGPGIEFELFFNGPQAGQVAVASAGNGPLPPFNPFAPGPSSVPSNPLTLCKPGGTTGPLAILPAC